MRVARSILLAALALAFGSLASAQEGYTPAPENLKARAWFQDARFGLFIHWGAYAVRGEGEWVMHEKRITVPEYERDLPPQFNPVRYDPAAWVAMAKAAGMKYITITSKHHDGFAMYDSKVSDYDVVQKSPYGKDVLKALADECKKEGIKLFFYYSQLDWHHPDYFPRGRTGLFAGRAEKGEWNRYLDYMDAQLKELLTGYGELGGIWFDGWWDKPDAAWRLGQTYKLIHDLQPQALIGANHHVKPFPGEDFQMFEKDLPGQNTAGFNEAGVSALPLESAQTMNNAWGYNLSDRRFKSERELIHFLIRAAGANANLLLNVGPKPDGTIQQEAVERLEKMGAWLADFGETIYSTRGGPMTPQDWGVMTENRDGTLFVHVLDAKQDFVVLPSFGKPVSAAKVWKTGQNLQVETHPWGTTLHLPETPAETHDLVVTIETR